MIRLIYPTLLILLTAACTAVDRSDTDKVRLTQKEFKQRERDAEQLKTQIAAKDMKIIEEEKSTSEIRRELDEIHTNCEELSEQIDEKLAEAEKLMTEIRDLNRKLGPPSAADEDAAEKLLVTARYFQKQNPTEAKKVVASKYKEVFDRYPRTEAAKEAKKIYEDLSR